MWLRPAKAEDLAHLDGVLERVLEQMQAQGLNQWDHHYPTRDLFRSDLEQGWLLVAAEKEGALPSASLCLNREQEPEYAGVDWQLQSESVHVVHRLMVDPAAEGHGFGQAASTSKRGTGCARTEDERRTPRTIASPTPKVAPNFPVFIIETPYSQSLASRVARRV